MIGHIDLHAAERRRRASLISATVVAFVVALTITSVLYFRNAWERENGIELLRLKGQAGVFVQMKQYEQAKEKYDALFGLLGDHTVADDGLRSEIESARLAMAENNKKVEPILAARAAAEQEERRRVAQRDAFFAATDLPKERYYRDGHGAIVSEREAEASLARIRSNIRSMPDNGERAYREGQLRAVEEEWARLKQKGPVEK